MVAGLSNIQGINSNSNYKTNTSGYSSNYEDQSIFNMKNPNEQDSNDKVAQDNAKGFKPKDLLEVDEFFIPKLKAAIGAAMTYLIAECSFKKCDTDGNGLLTSDEYDNLTTNYNFDLSGENKTTSKENKGENNIVKKIFNLISEVGASCSIMDIPGMKDVTEAFKNTLKMMIKFDTNNNGKIEKNEFNDLLDQKSTEQLPEDIKDTMYTKFISKQTSGQDGMDLGAFTDFAFASKLAWYPDKKINTQRVLSDFGKTTESNKETEESGKKKEVPMLV